MVTVIANVGKISLVRAQGLPLVKLFLDWGYLMDKLLLVAALKAVVDFKISITSSTDKWEDMGKFCASTCFC